MIFLPYFEHRLRANRNRSQDAKNCHDGTAATIIVEMRPLLIGRTLGVGLRIAGRIAGQCVDAAGTPSSAKAPAAGAPVDHAARGRAAGHATARTTKGVVRGLGGFLRPFGRVGGILWLEVTGVFFFLFVIAFAPALWRTRASYAHGPDHHTFWVSAALTAVFLYLSVSSFWRARRK